MPLTRIELATPESDEVINGRSFGIHPMRVTGLSVRQRIQVTLEGRRVDLTKWKSVPQYTALPPQLWDDSGAPEHGQGLEKHLTGVTLTSPDTDYGTSTGYIGEESFKFDPIRPDGVAPLSTDDRPLIPGATRPGGVVGRIAATVDTPGRAKPAARCTR